MASKVGIFLAVICLLQPQLSFASDVDWEILNFAISNPAQSNPAILKDAILNILGGFAGSVVPPMPTPGPTTTKAPVPTTMKVPTTTAAPQIIWSGHQGSQPFYINPIYYQAPSAPAAPAAAPVTHAHSVNYVHSHPLGQLHHQNRPDPCGPNKIGEFLVNVPCPKPTTKAPREIVVKLPCPTTKKPEESTCNCQCCPCNPCKPSKPTKPRKTTTTPCPTTTKRPKPTTTAAPSCESESASSSESCESYESYHPRGKFQRVKSHHH